MSRYRHPHSKESQRSEERISRIEDALDRFETHPQIALILNSMRPLVACGVTPTEAARVVSAQVLSPQLENSSPIST